MMQQQPQQQLLQIPQHLTSNVMTVAEPVHPESFKVSFTETGGTCSIFYNCYDCTHGYHDPVNAKLGYVLTSDELGHGSWQPLPIIGTDFQQLCLDRSN